LITPSENETRTALIISTLAGFMTPFMASSVNVALPTIGKEYSLDPIALGWIATAYLLSAAIFLIPFGQLADSYGRKKIFLLGIIVYSIFSFLIPSSGSGTVLIILRICQGVGAAMIFSTGVAILTSATPPPDRGKVLGINVASVYLGLSLGPFLGGFLTEYFSWQSIFYINGFFGLIVLIITIRKLKGEWIGVRINKFDIMGTVLFCFSMTVLIVGFSRLHLQVGIWMVVTGIITGVFLILWEKKASYPIININLFVRNRAFTSSNVAALINYCATAAVTFLMSLYLQNIKNLSPRTTGLVLVSQPICMAMISLFAGRLSDKIEPRYVASFGMLMTVIGLFFFIFIHSESSIVFIILNLILLGIGFGFFSSPNTNAIMSSVPKDMYGVASATVGTMRLSGQMLSMGIVLMMMSISAGSSTVTNVDSNGFLMTVRNAFIVFTVICFIGVFFSLARGNIREK